MVVTHGIKQTVSWSAGFPGECPGCLIDNGSPWSAAEDVAHNREAAFLYGTFHPVELQLGVLNY